MKSGVGGTGNISRSNLRHLPGNVLFNRGQRLEIAKGVRSMPGDHPYRDEFEQKSRKRNSQF